MKKNLRVITIIILFVTFVSIACGGTPTLAPTATLVPTEVPTLVPTEVPTQTPLPTYTPQPTYTPFPTPTKIPTEVPTEVSQVEENNPYDSDVYKGNGPVQIDCPNEDLVEGANKALCYQISGRGMGLVYLKGSNLVAYAIGIPTNSEDIAYDCGVFAAETADMYGWDPNDVVGILTQIEAPGVIYTSGNMSGKASMSDDGKYLYVMFMPAGGTSG